MIPVIDIFAGPGGLGEGFSSIRDYRRGRAFDIKLSIEMDSSAHETLKLRTFFREFARVPDTYYDFLRGRVLLPALYSRHPYISFVADSKVWRTELGKPETPQEEVRNRIENALGEAEGWVLIGGPPCQAYSLAGRSRNNRKKGYRFGDDTRTRLYLEYLQIISDHWPAVFVMENVKGLLSATLDSQRMFHRILEDLRGPRNAIKREGRPVRSGRTHRYRIHSLVQPTMFDEEELGDSVIHAERYGIPQARHRVILLGIRDDLGPIMPQTLVPKDVVPVSSVVGKMPKVRSGLSKAADSPAAWASSIKSGMDRRWSSSFRRNSLEKVQTVIRQVLGGFAPPAYDRGGDFIPVDASPDYSPKWFSDHRLGGVSQHSTRAHMAEDLHRYLFAACFAEAHGRSPVLQDFPSELLPKHHNVDLALDNGGIFSDRFRVQVKDRPATTITSHIAKDGHYYIHYDPAQCRSLTVREAARIQTFPDNYFFVGTRTSQYAQIGNAVPPLLARQIAKIVQGVLAQAGLGD